MLPLKFVPFFKGKQEAPLLLILLLPTRRRVSSSPLLKAFLGLWIVKLWETRPVPRRDMPVISVCLPSLTLENASRCRD